MHIGKHWYEEVSKANCFIYNTHFENLGMKIYGKFLLYMMLAEEMGTDLQTEPSCTSVHVCI